MKITLLGLAMLTLLAACQKDPLPTPTPYQPVIELGKVAMSRDGQEWTADFIPRYYYFPTTKSFGFSAEIDMGNGIVEKVRIADMPCQTGKFAFEDGNNFTWGNSRPIATVSWVLDEDQSLGGLTADTTYQDDFIEVIRFDSTENIAEGRFQVHLTNNWPAPPLFGLPVEMVLTNGRFNLKIE